MSRGSVGEAHPTKVPMMASQLDQVGEEKRAPAPGDKKIQCVVVTPEKTLFDEWVDFVALPLYDGEARCPSGPNSADRPARFR